MQEKKVMIYIEEGIVQNVFGIESSKLEIVDYDMLEGGDCPWCYGKLERKSVSLLDNVKKTLFRVARKPWDYDGTYLWCPNCEIDLDNTGAEEVYKMWMKGKLNGS